MRTNNNRRPRGFKQAKRNNVRFGAIPPTAWDDIPNTKLAAAYDYAGKLFPKVHTFGEFAEKFRQKYKWNKDEIREVFYWTKNNIP